MNNDLLPVAHTCSVGSLLIIVTSEQYICMSRRCITRRYATQSVCPAIRIWNGALRCPSQPSSLDSSHGQQLATGSSSQSTVSGRRGTTDRSVLGDRTLWRSSSSRCGLTPRQRRQHMLLPFPSFHNRPAVRSWDHCGLTTVVIRSGRRFEPPALW
jgi:hypothetical protein